MKIRKAEEEKKAMFGKKKDARARVPSSPETRYQSARSSLLLVVVLTAINLLLLVMRSSTQFLFSASFPSYLYIIADEFADYLGMGTVLRLGALAVGVCDIGLYLLFSVPFKECARVHDRVAGVVLRGLSGISLRLPDL